MCTCSLAEFLTLQLHKTTAWVWLDNMRCTVGMEFRIPTGPTFRLTTLDCLDGVGGVPIQSVQSLALSLHCQCLVLGTVSEVKTWRQGLWASAGGTVCCFKSTRFTFLFICYPFWFQSSSESVRSCHWPLRRAAVLDSLTFARGHKLSVEEFPWLHILLCGLSVTTASPRWRVSHWQGWTLCHH